MDGDDIRLIHGDCLEAMRGLEAGSVDLIACDLPYGTTACKWDSVIPFEPMWEQFERVSKINSVTALTSSQPFTSLLVSSNLKRFRHEWIWLKNRGSNFANTVREPMKEHESVLVFSAGSWVYNAQRQDRNGSGASRSKYKQGLRSDSEVYSRMPDKRVAFTEDRVPSSCQKFNTEVGYHPTQKPVALFEYLILTYSYPGNTVLDCTMGSGTTGVAAVNTGRRFIGVEQDPDYFRIAERRIDQARRPLVVGHPLSAHRRPRPAADRDPGQPTLFDSLS